MVLTRKNLEWWCERGMLFLILGMLVFAPLAFGAVEPWAYLQDVLTRLPSLAAGQLGELLPERWQAARQIPPATASQTNTPSAESSS